MNDRLKFLDILRSRVQRYVSKLTRSDFQTVWSMRSGYVKVLIKLTVIGKSALSVPG